MPNPVKDKAHQLVLAARAHRERMNAVTDVAMVVANTPEGAGSVLVTNAVTRTINEPFHQVHSAVLAAEVAHQGLPARLPLRQLNPGQQVLETRLKQFTHLIGITAYMLSMSLARDIRTNTDYRRAHNEAHALVRKIRSLPSPATSTRLSTAIWATPWIQCTPNAKRTRWPNSAST